MPSRTVTWRCNKCRKRFYDYREAESCEIGHIASEVISDFSGELARILNIEPKTISPKERMK